MRLVHDEFSCPVSSLDKGQSTKENLAFELSRKIARSGLQNDAFLLANEDQLHLNFDKWTKDFPNIQPYFDVAFNACPWLLKTLSQEHGVKFSAHSKAEIQHLTEQGLNDGASILFSGLQPKMASHMKFANASNVSMMSVCSMADLKKAQKANFSHGLLLVLQNEDTNKWLEMFQEAKEAGLDFVGVSLDTEAFGLGLDIAKKMALARMALALGRSLGHSMNVIDLGSLSNQDKGFFKDAKASSKGSLTLIAHLGAAFIEDVFTCSAKIIGKRLNPDRSRGTLVINDGIFQSFQRLLIEDQADLALKPLKPEAHECGPLIDVDIYGSSGDDMDILVTDFGLAALNLERDDWLFFGKMGAFSISLQRRMISVKLPEKFGNFRLFSPDHEANFEPKNEASFEDNLASFEDQNLDMENALMNEENLQVVFLDIQGNNLDISNDTENEQQMCLDLFEELPSLTLDTKFCNEYEQDFYSDLNR